MEKLKKELDALKLEMEDMQNAWAKEIKLFCDKPGFDINSKKTDRAFEKIADRYAEQMDKNFRAQNKIADELSRLAEIERKKLYKD